MLKIYENLLTGTLFEQKPWVQIQLKLKNFCAHHKANDKTVVLSTENVQKSHLGPKLWVFENWFPSSDFWGTLFKKAATPKNFEQTNKFQKPACSR